MIRNKILLWLIFFGSISFSQKVLTLEESISIALNESYSIKSAKYSLISSQKNLEALQRGLMTSVNFEFDLPRYSRTLSSQFNPLTGTEQFFEIGYTTFESRLLFSQPIVFTNGTFSLAGSLWRRDQFNAAEDIPVDYYSNLSLRLSQPLFTFNDQKANLERAEINLQKSERNHTRSEKEVIYQVTVNFLMLYQTKAKMEIKYEEVKQTEISYTTALNKFKAGLIAEVEALQLEIDLATSRNELLDAERLYIDAKNEFKLLIGLDINEVIDVSAHLDYNPISVDLENAIDLALDKRTELLNANDDIQLSNIELDEVDSRGNISALLFANFGINRNNEQFRDIFRDFAEDRNIIFTLRIPVIDWGKNNLEVESAEANLQLDKLNYQNQKQLIKKEIIAVVNKLESAKERVDVLSKNVELAEKSYDISLSRFQSGTITSFDLSQMQLRLTNARINSLNALIDYKVALADLNRKTLHDFDRD